MQRVLLSVILSLSLLGGAARATAADKLTVLLDWFVNPDHATLIIAGEKGFFEAQGLDVELIAPADPNDPPKLVAAGKADLAITYQPQLHMQVGEGLPLKRVATLIATPLNSVVVLRDGPVKSLADLKGRKIGYSIGGFETALLKRMLEPHGVTLDELTLINVNFSLSPSLLAGQVDAVIGAFRNFELNQLDIEGSPGRAFFPEEEGVPAYDELILVANSANLEDARLPRFIEALEQAAHYLVNHPEESWELFIRNHKDLDDELNRRAFAATLPRFALRPAALDSGRYERFAAFLLQQGLIREAKPASDYAVVIR
ncbi:ABC transporter substrate-binding protein [Sneathiella sp.]|uniref:ABC transporter substrate-binding protein n=1 Tax=Sneathiella sp. TaxID=1964365 RepID=UPI002FE31803